MLCKSRAFGMCCISKIIKDRTLQLIANKKLYGLPYTKDRLR